MQPIRYLCEGALADKWIETSVRDGLTIISHTDEVVTVQYHEVEYSIEVHRRDGYSELDLESIRNTSLRLRLDWLLRASGATCSIPDLYCCLVDALYRCSIATVPRWLDRLRNSSIGLDSLVKRDTNSGAEFFDGIATTSNGSRFRFTTGAAYDPVDNTACDFVEMEIQPRGFFVGDMEWQSVRESTRHFDDLKAVAIILHGELSTKRRRKGDCAKKLGEGGRLT